MLHCILCIAGQVGNAWRSTCQEVQNTVVAVVAASTYKHLCNKNVGVVPWYKDIYFKACSALVPFLGHYSCRCRASVHVPIAIAMSRTIKPLFWRLGTYHNISFLYSIPKVWNAFSLQSLPCCNQQLPLPFCTCQGPWAWFIQAITSKRHSTSCNYLHRRVFISAFWKLPR